MMMIGTIVTPPDVVERDGDFEVYCAIVELASGDDPPPRVQAIFPAIAPGIGFAFERGMRVRLWVVGGSSFVISTCESSSADGTNHLLLAPTEGNVRIGRSKTASYQSAMGYNQANADIRELRNKLSEVMVELGTLMGGPAGIAMGEAGLALLGDVYGGQPTEGLQVQVDTGPEVEP